MPTYTFDKVSVKRTKYWKDENGKKRQKTREFFQTLNPFNTDESGNPKSRRQILKEVETEAEAWMRKEGI